MVRSVESYPLETVRRLIAAAQEVFWSKHFVPNRLIDRDKVEFSLRELARLGCIDDPKIHWVTSPREAARAYSLYCNPRNFQSFWVSEMYQIYAMGEAQGQFRRERFDNLFRLEQQMNALVNVVASSAGQSTLGQPFGSSFLASFGRPTASVALDVCLDLGLMPSDLGIDESARHLSTLLSEGHWFWGDQNQVICCQFPTSVSLDEAGRLHSSQAPAISYSDGFEVYAWHGVAVDKQVILHPEELKPSEVLKQGNAEVRRVMMELMGSERLVDSPEAKLVSQDSKGKLWEFVDREDTRLLLVEVENSTLEQDGTRKRYFLRVPPGVTTPTEGLAWTFEVEDYNPSLET